jgi:hypothetical protein
MKDAAVRSQHWELFAGRWKNQLRQVQCRQKGASSMIQAHRENGKWYLVYNLRLVQQQSQPAYQKCWSGIGWEEQSHFGKIFESRDEAVGYFKENRIAMEAAL